MTNDLHGRSVVVTGASSGLGLAATRRLSDRGAAVVMAVRNVDKAERVRRGLGAADRVTVLELDLANLASVEAFSLNLLGQLDRLDVLLNNAGVMATPAALTPDGIEQQWATNHLGHFALTGHLIEALLATAGSRVVAVSSLAAASGDLTDYDPTDLTGYRRFAAYANSKLANLVFATELDRRLGVTGSDSIALAAHPGITHTNLISGTRLPGLQQLMKLASRILTQSVDVGVDPLLRAALEPEAQGGDYWGPSGRDQRRGAATVVPIPTVALTEGIGTRLWQQSIRLSGVDYLTDL